MGEFLIKISGVYRPVLDECPADRGKYIGIGASILTTATMAAVSLAFALVTVLHAALWATLPFSVAWGLAIFSLDRMFIASMQRQDSKWASLWFALPRFLLSLLLGAVISTPFVLVIFQPEINQQITVIQDNKADAYYHQLSTSSLTRRIAAEQKEVDNLSEGNPATGPVSSSAANRQLATLQGQLSKAEKIEAADAAKLNCQLYGGPGCPPGYGVLARDYQEKYTSDQAQVTAITAEIARLQLANNARLAGAAKVATGELASAQAQLARDTAEQKHQTADFVKGNKRDTGLLIRLQALTAVSSGSLTLKLAQLLLFLTLTIVDCMPVLLKLLQNLQRESTYEATLRLRQETQIAEAEAWAASQKNRLDGVRADLPWVTDNVKQARKDVEDAWIKAWRAEQLRRIANGQHISPPGNGRQSPPASATQPGPPLGRGRGWRGVWPSQPRPFQPASTPAPAPSQPRASRMVLQRFVPRPHDQTQKPNGGHSS